MPAPISGVCCGNCAYYEQREDTHGECRRYAPHPNPATYVPKVESVGQIKIDVHWPKVYSTNWCGQFASRQKATQKAD
ncbi:MAG: hypothetical protein DRP56_01940 [Planctomycetota bacterium]|nr:MAG: hypothetical protein DRP56_01940 [Planctomycetota bacterium]RKY13426.1 MAG: hypothetical protein DRP52_02830 [Planctomycetota bacterium]